MSEAELPVGLLFPRSGRYAGLGAHLVGACEIALAVARERGTNGADQVRLVSENAVDAEGGRAGVRRLAEAGAVAIVGSELSDVAVAAAAEAHARGVLFWEVEAVIGELTARPREGVFRFNCDAASFGATPVDFVADLLAARASRDARSLRLGILGEDTPYGRSTADGASGRARERRLDVRVDERVSVGGDLGRALRRCGEAGVEVLIASGYSDHAIATFDAVRDADLDLLALVGAGAGYNTDRFAEHAGSAGEGVFVTGNAPSTAFDESRLAPAARALLARYRGLAAAAGRPGRDADLELAFQGTLVLLEHVLARATSTSRAALDAAARAIDVPDGDTIVGFGVRFAASGQNEHGCPAVMRRDAGVMRAVFPAIFASTEIPEAARVR